MVPSIEVIIKIADALEVSIDYLVGKTTVQLDKATLKRLQDIQKLSDDNRSQLFMVVDALIRDFKAKKSLRINWRRFQITKKPGNCRASSFIAGD